MTAMTSGGEGASARELMAVAGAQFDDRVHAVPAGAWGNPTPCTDWDVRALVNHVVGEQLWAARLLRGETIEQVGDRFDGDVLGADPVAAWEAAWAAARPAWDEVEDDTPVDLSSGPTPAADYADEMLLDLVVHGWDLARGAGLDETGDPRTVAHALRTAEQNSEAWAGSAAFAAPVDVRSDDPQDRLLGLLGRRP
jgi:uncharacterized protein (TIGR03086 family)